MIQELLIQPCAQSYHLISGSRLCTVLWKVIIFNLIFEYFEYVLYSLVGVDVNEQCSHNFTRSCFPE